MSCELKNCIANNDFLYKGRPFRSQKFTQNYQRDYH